MLNTKEQVQVLKALGDEMRLTIFKMLAKQELCACDILEEIEITQSTLSYHMKILTDSKLVLSRKNGNWTNYRLNKKRITELSEFIYQFAVSEPLPFTPPEKDEVS